MDAKTTRKAEKQIKVLQAIVQTLPEYKALMKILPPNHNLSLTIEEDATVKTLNDMVEYDGFVAGKGNNPYLVMCCGSSYFESSLSIQEIADKIKEIVNQEIQNPTKKFKGMDFSNYGEELRITLRIADEFGATDEVYPHMRDKAIGAFIVKTPE